MSRRWLDSEEAMPSSRAALSTTHAKGDGSTNIAILFPFLMGGLSLPSTPDGLFSAAEAALSGDATAAVCCNLPANRPGALNVTAKRASGWPKKELLCRPDMQRTGLNAERAERQAGTQALLFVCEDTVARGSTDNRAAASPLAMLTAIGESLVLRGS